MRIISRNKGPENRSNGVGGSNKCTRIRTWLYTVVNSRFALDAGWVQKHIADCPRCRRRLAAVGKVNLALSAAKTEPHRTDLLMRANTQAIGVLKHSLRGAPKASKLKKALPRPTLLEQWGGYAHSLANLAACIVVLFLMKVGVFSSMDRFQTEGRKVVKQYYASQVGQDLADDIFNT